MSKALELQMNFPLSSIEAYSQAVNRIPVLSKEEAEVLNTMQMQPAFLLEHIFYDLDDEPVSWGKFICRGDHFEFRAKVGIRNRK